MHLQGEHGGIPSLVEPILLRDPLNKFMPRAIDAPMLPFKPSCKAMIVEVFVLFLRRLISVVQNINKGNASTFAETTRSQPRVKNLGVRAKIQMNK